MRYQGRLEFPDENAADVVVSVEVTDTHVRLASGDESLGSWCLADVVAERVVANEFLLDLQGEAIRFIADDPVNFAYGAVQGMAEGWARYHSMNPVSRKRAVSTARRKNDPSRLADARRVFVAAGARLLPDPEPAIETAAEMLDEVVEPAPTAVDAPVEVQTPVEGMAPVIDEPGVPPDPGTHPSAPESDAGERGETEVLEPTPTQAAVVAGRLRRLNAFPAPRPAVGDVADDPVVEDDAVVEPGHPPRRSRRQRHVAIQPEPIEAAVTEVSPDAPEPDPIRPEAVEPVAVEAPEDVTEIVLPGPETADPDPIEAPSEPADARFTPVSRTAWRSPDAVRAPVEAAPAPSRPQSGAFKDGHHPAETTGLRATVKSMFGRQSQDHEHSFVESTTAVGLTRRVCLECGYVSIGVSD